MYDKEKLNSDVQLRKLHEKYFNSGIFFFYTVIHFSDTLIKIRKHRNQKKKIMTKINVLTDRLCKS